MLNKFIAFQLAKELYSRCKTQRLPRFLHDQLLRASSSVALNLAEGSGKQTAPEQRRFYAIALGSLRECEAILELEGKSDPDLMKLIDRMGAIIYSISRKPTNRGRTESGTATETETENS